MTTRSSDRFASGISLSLSVGVGIWTALWLTTCAHSHETGSALRGEVRVSDDSFAEALWRLFLPEAGAAAEITVDGDYRYISANGYPDAEPGVFPNRGNPHSISTKSYQLRVPLIPTLTGEARFTGPGVFGISIDGVLFDPGTAEAWQSNRRSGWNYEALGGACSLGLDNNKAHVQPDGTYHYHGLSPALMQASGGQAAPALLGYAADGFPIYGPYGYSDPDNPSPLKKLASSYRLKAGPRPPGSGNPGGTYNGVFTQDWTFIAGAGDLDMCNGRVAVTPEYPKGTYHYVLTDSFPFIPRCWAGTPDESFQRLKTGPGGAGGPDGGQGRGGRAGHPPPPPGGGLFGFFRGDRPGGPPPGGGQRTAQAGGGRTPCSGN